MIIYLLIDYYHPKITTMSKVIKSKRMIISNQQQRSVAFSCFLNDEKILILFSNSTFIVVCTKESSNNKIVFEDKLQREELILDCKRIKKNVCAIVTNNVQSISFVKYVSDVEVMIGSIFISQMAFFKNIQVVPQIIVFGNTIFMIKNEQFSQKVTYFTIFNEQQKSSEFNFNISVFNYQQDPLSNKQELFKTLPFTKQICYYKQNEEDGLNWIIRIIPLTNNNAVKEIELSGNLTQAHWIQDIVVKNNDQYLVFASKMDQEHKIEVYHCQLYLNQQKYTQTFVLRQNFDMGSRLFLEVLDVNQKQRYFLSKTAAFTSIDNQIYDSYLEIRDLTTGKLIDQLPCNLKSIDISPNRSHILDYAQNINPIDPVIIHLRYIFGKDSLYYFMLGRSPLLGNNTNLCQIYPQILKLL